MSREYLEVAATAPRRDLAHGETLLIARAAKLEFERIERLHGPAAAERTALEPLRDPLGRFTGAFRAKKCAPLPARLRRAKLGDLEERLRQVQERIARDAARTTPAPGRVRITDLERELAARTARWSADR